MTGYVSAVEACRLAGLDRQRFNEDISSGLYTCAPSTTAGRARRFERDDIAALLIYARLVTGGVPRTTAGSISALARKAMRSEHCPALLHVDLGDLKLIDPKRVIGQMATFTVNVWWARERSKVLALNSDRVAP